MKASKIHRLEEALPYARDWLNSHERWFVFDELANEHDLRWLCKRLQPEYDYILHFNISMKVIGSQRFFEGNDWTYQ